MKKGRVLALGTALCAIMTCGCSPGPGMAGIPKEKIWVIAADTEFEPFVYWDKNGELTGVDVDIIAAVAKDQGFDYEFQPLGWDAAVSAVRSGQADAIMSGATISQERIDEGWIFSEGYFESSQTFVTAEGSGVSSFEDLRGETVAVKNGTAGADFADSLKDKYGFTLIVYENSPTMYQDVLLGNSAACVEDKPVIETAVKDEGLALAVPEGMESGPSPYGLAVMDEENRELLEMFNTGLANIKADGTYDAILAKYFAG